MNEYQKTYFARQMYTPNSEIGRMKLQSVKENLYEATTKVVLYSVEMYTKTSLHEWVKTGLLLKLDKANNDLKRNREELEQGYIGMFDITNGCSVINDFVRKDSLAVSRNELQARIEFLKLKIAAQEEKQAIIEERRAEIEKKYNEEGAFPEQYEDDKQNSTVADVKESDDNYDDTLDDELEDETVKQNIPSEIMLFKDNISRITNPDEIDNICEDIKEEQKILKERIAELNSLTKSGKDILTSQFNDEKKSLEDLRTLRNTTFAHKNEDQQEISRIGTWEPEAGPLYQWASEILKYIKIIENRYRIYALFDEFYASKEGKGNFDGCKVYVQRQIKELYVNRSGVNFEFAGELYDRDDDEYNFMKLIENMAISWDTGLRYLTVVTNEDLPELNAFFKECLSGTSKYVDYYLFYRNAIKDAYKREDYANADCLYFKFLYLLNPTLEKIFWKSKDYTQRDFARQVLYKLVKVKNMFQFDARLKNFERFIDGVDVKKWCEHHLLSELYFAGLDDARGKSLAFEMEDAILKFCEHGENKGRMPLYRRAIRALVQLYFYMGGECIFSYTRSNGQTLRWRTLDDARKYVENTDQFESYGELCSFVDEMYKSDYFRLWRVELRKNEAMR